MRFVIRHLWVVPVVVVALSHRASMNRLREVTREDPVARTKSSRLLIGSSLFQLVPWLVLGAGILAGSIDSVFAAFSPRLDNPFVAAVWIFAIAGSALVSIWILAGGGASYVSRYGAGLSPQPIPVSHVRLMGIVLALTAVAMAWWAA